MKRRKWTGLALAVTLAAGLLLTAGPAFADEAAKDKATQDKAAQNEPVIQEIVEQMEDPNADPFAFRTKRAAEAEEEQAKDYPEKFDLRDVEGKNYVTPIKFQNPFGTCWGFAAIAASEISILGDDQVDKGGKTAETLDLSEKHVVNFIYRPLDDPTSSQNGEGMSFRDKTLTLTDKFNMGGFSFFATNLFASGLGPNQEDRDIIPEAPAGTPEDIYEYHGVDSKTEQRLPEGATDWIDFCYNTDDDWSIPEQLRFTQSYALEESYILPSPAQYVGEANDIKYEYDPAATAAIKEQLMQKRGVEISFYADTSLPNQDPNSSKYISENWAHYTYRGESANHGVCIVGWDDAYPKENFLKGHQPPENGAWLVKNSWGSGEREFPNRGNGNWGIPNEKGEGTGYFWLSYYDMSLTNPEALDFENKPSANYYIDQYDYMPVIQIGSADVKGEVSFSNVFQAEQSQQLQQITCQTAAPGSIVDYQIYLLSPGHRNPQDGILVASGSKEFPLGGFHKIQLAEDQRVDIQRNQYYSVILTQRTPDGKYNINAPLGLSDVLAEAFEAPFYVTGVINPGESYVKTDGTWQDYSDIQVRGDLVDSFGVIGSADNFPIKAVSAPKDDLSIQMIGGNELTMSLTGKNAEKNPQIRIRAGKNAGKPGTPIEWAPADENSGKLFTVTPNEKNPMSCTVKAVATGTGYLTVSVPNVGTQVIRVDVKTPPAPEVSLTAASKQLTVAVTHSDLYSELTGCEIRYREKGQASWKNAAIDLANDKIVLKNLKLGAQYEVQARDYDTYNGSAVYGDWSAVKTSEICGMKKPAAPKVTLKVGKKKLTVKVKHTAKKSTLKGTQIRYKVKGTKKWKKVKISVKKNQRVLKKLKTDKRYQVQARDYGVYKGKTVYGKWSKVKTSKKIK